MVNLCNISNTKENPERAVSNEFCGSFEAEAGIRVNDNVLAFKGHFWIHGGHPFPPEKMEETGHEV